MTVVASLEYNEGLQSPDETEQNARRRLNIGRGFYDRLALPLVAS